MRHQPSQTPQKHIKVLLCQLKPIFKDPKSNISRVSKSLALYSSKDKLDVVLFPEMSFIGYNFQNKQDALPYAIRYGDKQSGQFKFACELARKLEAYVLFGYIEKELKNGNVILYNSAAVIDRKGEPVLNCRKTHLYYCDQLWCQEGDGFKNIDIINTKGETFRATIGICMDINPKNFTSGQYQWADFAVKNNSQILLFLTNWVDSQAQSVQDSAVLAMYNYWLHRLRPMISITSQKKIKDPVIFFAADRVGKQYSYYDKKQTQFFGSSCAIHLNPPYVIQKLSKLDEGYLVVQAKLPKKKL